MSVDEASFDSIDLVEARTGTTSDSQEMPSSYTVRRGSWEEMTTELLEKILRDAGSIRRAAKLIGVPRSTLGSWVAKKTRPRAWSRRGSKQKGPA